ncbi:MAG TPA: hypothetical protein VGR01_09135 [Burkholderiales bacterium]|jgi:hypothetical protein|nr:hypothetical protein [Burkholderiales bacterium]
MIGFVKSSTIIAILLLSATFAYAGDLRPAPSGGNNMHPAPQGSKDTAVEMVGQHAQSSAAIEAVSKVQEDKLRRLRPVK